jgi:ethanolamine utilization protein EutQ (cupin superfamily)
LDNSTALVTAASGLERLMVGSNNDVLRDSMVAQISAYLYYNAQVMGQLTNNKAFQAKFTKTIFEQIQKDFGAYVDAQARVRPKALHHVYEWKRIGNPNARLFKLKVTAQEGISFKIGYEFLDSKTLVPTTKGVHRHVFVDKAFVMEEGRPVTIRPRFAERLVFEVPGGSVFMPKGKPVTVSRPGGKAATNQFKLAYGKFFSGNLVNNSIKNSGFQKLFGASMAKALKVPAGIKKVQYRFTPNTLRLQADFALHQSFGGVL